MQTPPAPPPPAQGPKDYTVKIGTNGIKISEAGQSAEIAELQAQLQVYNQRLTRLNEEIFNERQQLSAEGAGPAGVAAQARIVSLESRRKDTEEALQKVEDQLAAKGVVPNTVEGITAAPPGEPMVPFDPNQAGFQESIAAVAIFLIVFVGAPISVAIARYIWKRTTTRPAPAPSADDARRLERVEAAVDAIAVEVERMSEGQRYVTKLLAERAGPVPAEPIANKAGVPAERR